MENNNSARERLETVIKLSGMKRYEFAQEIGVSSGTISHITSPTGRQAEMTENIASRIIQRFPNLNLSYDWLMNGTGDMHNAPASPHQPTLFDAHEKPNTPDADEHTAYKPSVPQQTEVSESVAEGNYQTAEQVKPAESEKNNAPEPHHVTDVLKNIPENGHFPKDSERKLERIVMFYSDGTFVEYLPQK